MNVRQWLRHFFSDKAKSKTKKEEWTELVSPVGNETTETKEDLSSEENFPGKMKRESAADEFSLPEFPEKGNTEEKDFQKEGEETNKKKNVEKHLLNALAGMSDPFQGEKALADFLDLGWETTEKTILSFILGRRPCLNTYLKRILESYPNECSAIFADHIEEIESEKRLLFLGCGYGGSAEDVAAAVEELLPEMDNDDLSRGFSVLAAVPSTKGNDLLASYLKSKDWRIALKAASSLEKAGAKDKIKAIGEAAEGEDIPAEAFLEIVRRMEGK